MSLFWFYGSGVNNNILLFTDIYCFTLEGGYAYMSTNTANHSHRSQSFMEEYNTCVGKLVTDLRVRERSEVSEALGPCLFFELSTIASVNLYK